ncbi:MAG: hypothetical protein JSW32_01685, partial [Deltaproteobacteria bacterium]
RAVVLELERRAATGGKESIDTVVEEFDGLVRRGGFWDQPYQRARAEAARAKAALSEGCHREAIERAEEADRWAREKALHFIHEVSR